ncbi:MAG: hypothetical protein KAQ89_00595 [Planctomycetes bacterium]|nr:hypothetical protein [Planctomycetota bacterium]
MYLIAAIVVVWIILSVPLDLNHCFLPDATTFFTAAIKEIEGFEIFKHLGITIGRVFAGVIVSLVIGIPSGIYLSYKPNIKKQVMPLVELARSLPTSMLFPVFIFFIGFGELSKIMIVSYLSIPIIVISIVGSDMGKSHVQARRDYFCLHRDRIKSSVYIETIFWDSLPALVSGIKLAISLSLVVVIVTEMFFVSSSGLGWKAHNAYLELNIDALYVYIVSTAILGLVLNAIFNFGFNKFKRITSLD